MNEVSQLINWAKDIIEKYPSLKAEINDFVQLAIDEIEQGESPVHEIELCMTSIQELVQELKQSKN